MRNQAKSLINNALQPVINALRPRPWPDLPALVAWLRRRTRPGQGVGCVIPEAALLGAIAAEHGCSPEAAATPAALRSLLGALADLDPAGERVLRHRLPQDAGVMWIGVRWATSEDRREEARAAAAKRGVGKAVLGAVLAGLLLCCGLGSAHAQDAGLDLTGSTLSQQSGIPVASGQSVVPQIFQAYLPGASLSTGEITGAPSEVAQATVSADAVSLLVTTVATAARGQSDAGKKFWLCLWVAFGVASIGGAFWRFKQIAEGKTAPDEAWYCILYPAIGAVLLQFVAGFMPNVLLAVANDVTGTVAPVQAGGTQEDQSVLAHAYKLVAVTLANSRTMAAAGAQQVVGAASREGANINTADYVKKYAQVFQDGFFNIAGTKYTTAAAMAQGLVTAAKSGKGMVGGENAALSATSTGDTWASLPLAEREAKVGAVVDVSAKAGIKAYALALKTDLNGTPSPSSDGIAARAAGMSDAQVYGDVGGQDGDGNAVAHGAVLWRAFGLGFAGQRVDSSDADKASKWITLCLRFVAFLAAVEIWATPWVWAASAISLQFGRPDWVRAVEFSSYVLVTVFLASILAGIALSNELSKLAGASSAWTTGSFVSWLSGLSVDTMIACAALLSLPPILGALVVYGEHKGLEGVTKAANPDGIAGAGTVGGLINSVPGMGAAASGAQRAWAASEGIIPRAAEGIADGIKGAFGKGGRGDVPESRSWSKKQ